MSKMTWLVDLGTRDYKETWDLQKSLVERRIAGGIPDTLLLVEHPEVITLGVRGKADDVFATDMPVYRVERGGEATYHGPGQLVGYPIFSLKEWPGVMDFVRRLEDAIMAALKDFGIEPARGRQTGVWAEGRKIASIGLAVKNNVTYHGFAVNVSNNLSRFALLRPCGMDSSAMTSLAAVAGRGASVDEFKTKMLVRFGETFRTKLEERSLSGL